MNKFKKRLLSCLLCATGGLNLNAKALNSTPEQSRSKISVRKYSQEGGIFSFRSLLEALVVGYCLHDRYQDRKKNKKFVDMNAELNNKEKGLNDKEKELNLINKNLQAKIDEVNTQTANLKDECKALDNKEKELELKEQELELKEQKLCEKSKKQLSDMEAYAYFFNYFIVNLEEIAKQGNFSEWKNFDREKQEIEYITFNEAEKSDIMYAVNGHFEMDKNFSFKKFKQLKDYNRLIDPLNIKDVKKLTIFGDKDLYAKSNSRASRFYHVDTGDVTRLCAKYINFGEYDIIFNFYYNAPHREKCYEERKIFVMFSIGHVTDKK